MKMHTHYNCRSHLINFMLISYCTFQLWAHMLSKSALYVSLSGMPVALPSGIFCIQVLLDLFAWIKSYFKVLSLIETLLIAQNPLKFFCKWIQPTRSLTKRMCIVSYELVYSTSETEYTNRHHFRKRL